MNKSLTALLAVALGCASWQTVHSRLPLYFNGLGEATIETNGLPANAILRDGMITYNEDGPIQISGPYNKFNATLLQPDSELIPQESHRVSNFSIHDIDTLRNGAQMDKKKEYLDLTDLSDITISNFERSTYGEAGIRDDTARGDVYVSGNCEMFPSGKPVPWRRVRKLMAGFMERVSGNAVD